MSNNAQHKSQDSANAWESLKTHQRELADTHIKDFFDEDAQRFKNMSLSLPGLLFDYSKHKINDDTLPALIALAKACDVEGQRDRMFLGEVINTTENRPVLHIALRGSCEDTLEIDGENVSDFVQESLKQIQSLSDEVRNNSAIKDVVNIGIGGSDLGPRTVYKALKPLSDGPNVHYISNIDGSTLDQRLQNFKAASTLFIISSKTFTTLETMTNAHTVKAWLTESLGEERATEHFIAVTSNPKAAQNFGVAEERTLPMRDWIGGRYSLWSGIGLSIAISNGFDEFSALLKGAKAMDTHFKAAPLHENMPVILAMLGIWYRNFWNYPALAILPYSHDLRDLPTYLQQLDMESNGKSVDVNGEAVQIDTGPVIFGEAGTNAQHAFMQLLHQGTEIIPADFVLVAEPTCALKDHHTKLLANALAQSKALMEGHQNTQEPHRNFEGNRPSSTLVLDRLDGFHLGMLLALYEHKTFVQGVIWGLNSFDQWGVELGKSNTHEIIEALENNKENKNLDPSTAGLMAHLHQKFIKS
ncbi:MAG: glucose-6-phosphate isomerase [Pseudomonadota bacterium]